MTLKRPLAVAGATVLLSLGLTACGGDAPANASVKEFCAAVEGSANKVFLEAVQSGDFKKLVDLIKEDIKKIEEVGTPKDIPKEAREGFELQIKASKKMNAKELEKALKSATGGDVPFTTGLSDGEIKKVEAYFAYQTKTCGGVDLPSDLPTNLPTDLPSNFPTELPSNFPTELPSDLSSLMSDLPTSLEEMMSSLPSDLPTSAEDLESYLAELSKQ